ncbi:uncharacterized protein [Spinacia oleracea]|uniref:RNase H type-1 domain-containing protein n=1 Tax=Spinacia oleracea TaxID=3562 RepID=A0ABM3R9A4_SPIOL|nr:uncharacterized protein LOC130467645 [Spinacia oleracea]
MLGRAQVGSDEESDMWKLVWNLGGPPKLSHFVWQACKGSMAVRGELFRRHIALDDLCSCCGLEVETINHVLFECEVAKHIWDGSNFASLINGCPSVSFPRRLRWIASKVSIDEVRCILTMAWGIWFCRNKFVHDQTKVDAPSTIAGFLKLVDDYRAYSGKVFAPITTTQYACLSSSSWVPPPSGIVKVNIDAHIMEGEYVGLGVVIRDMAGVVLVAATRRIKVGWNACTSEAAAARYGMQVARRCGYNSIWLESDALNVVKAIDRPTIGYSPLFLIYDDINMLSKSFNVFVISHVKRAGNTVAHLVARCDTKDSSELVCMETIPQSILSLAVLDLQ